MDSTALRCSLQPPKASEVSHMPKPVRSRTQTYEAHHMSQYSVGHIPEQGVGLCLSTLSHMQICTCTMVDGQIIYILSAHAR